VNCDSGGENLFLEKFLELNEDELKKMQLSMHIRSSDDTEAFELLFLLLSRHKSPDGQSEQLDLDAVSVGGPGRCQIGLQAADVYGCLYSVAA
jgi:hypothetical protein